MTENSTFEHPAYLNSGKKGVETYIYCVLGKIIVANLMDLEGISTEDLNTKTYFMS